MANNTVYYDYYEGKQVPIWYVIHDRFDWSESTFYIKAPFQMHEAADFDDQVLNISILISDLIRNPDKPNQLGINLSAVRKRIEEADSDPFEISQFIIQVVDIEEVLQMDIFRD